MANDLRGEWELVSVRGKVGNEWKPEKVFCGRCVYLPDGRFVVFFKTEQMAFGMCGSYEFQESRLTTMIDGASFDVLDGSRHAREVTFETADRFRIQTIDPATGTQFENVWSRCLHS